MEDNTASHHRCYTDAEREKEELGRFNGPEIPRISILPKGVVYHEVHVSR